MFSMYDLQSLETVFDHPSNQEENDGQESILLCTITANQVPGLTFVSLLLTYHPRGQLISLVRENS